MATSGVGWFHDDVAVDVRTEYLALIARGAGDRKALTTMVREWKDSIKDVDDGPVFWLALAATQWECGRLHPRAKSHALKIIDRRKDEHRWVGSRLQKKRRAVLAQLKKKLLSPQPERRTPRLRVITPPPAFDVPSPDGKAQASARFIGPDPWSGLPACQVYIEMKSKRSEGGGSVFVAYCALTDIKLKWLDADTLRISYPKEAEIEQRNSTCFYYGRTIAVKYRRYQR